MTISNTRAVLGAIPATWYVMQAILTAASVLVALRVFMGFGATDLVVTLMVFAGWGAHAMTSLAMSTRTDDSVTDAVIRANRQYAKISEIKTRRLLDIEELYDRRIGQTTFCTVDEELFLAELGYILNEKEYTHR